MPGFDRFFEHLVGANLPPHGWQTELAESAICANRMIRIPTGFGKTLGVLAAWAWHRIHRKDDAWPRRLVWCLPMRVLVEQTEQEVRRALRALDILREDGARDDRVGVHLLMGGADSGEWHIYPEACAVLIGTQDMLLSRAMNRGYNGLSDARCGPAVGQRQVKDELAAEFADLRIRQRHIARQQLGAYPADTVAVLKQAPPDKDHHVPSGVASLRHPLAQRRILLDTAATVAFEHDPACLKDAGKTDHALGLCLLHLQGAAARAKPIRGSKIDHRRLRKQRRRAHLPVQLLVEPDQNADGRPGGVFFKPWLSNKARIWSARMRTAVLADTRRANSAASADGCRMNSASTSTAISAGSTADDTDGAMARYNRIVAS